MSHHTATWLSVWERLCSYRRAKTTRWSIEIAYVHPSPSDANISFALGDGGRPRVCRRRNRKRGRRLQPGQRHRARFGRARVVERTHLGNRNSELIVVRELGCELPICSRSNVSEIYTRSASFQQAISCTTIANVVSDT